MGACSDQALNRTWVLIEKTKNKNNKMCQANVFLQKLQNCIQNSSQKSFFPFCLYWRLVLTGSLKEPGDLFRPWELIRNFSFYDWADN